MHSFSPVTPTSKGALRCRLYCILTNGMGNGRQLRCLQFLLCSHQVDCSRKNRQLMDLTVLLKSLLSSPRFDTNLPGLVLSEQFLQVSTRLASEKLFGFGEHRHLTLRHGMDWKRWSMFTRDSGPNVRLHWLCHFALICWVLSIVVVAGGGP